MDLQKDFRCYFLEKKVKVLGDPKWHLPTSDCKMTSGFPTRIRSVYEKKFCQQVSWRLPTDDLLCLTFDLDLV